MRIAFVTFEYPPFVMGGAGVYAANITRELAKHGHEITVFTPRMDESYVDPEIADLEVRRINIRKGYPFAAFQFWLSMPEAIKKAEQNKVFDIIHLNGISYGFHKRKLSRAPHIITIHHLCADATQSCNLTFLDRLINISSERSIILPSIEKRCIECSDRIIAVSKFTKDRIVQTYKVRPEKIEMVYNGIAIEKRIYSNSELNELAKRLKLNGKPIILFVGRVDDPRKGLDLLLKAFKKILSEIDVNLLVIGQGNQDSMRRLSESLGISKNVYFLGFLNDEDLKKCYSLSNMLVVPSRLEGFGLTIIEALAHGKPIIATEVGAIPEIIKHNENGILVPPEDIDALFEAIRMLLQDQELVDAIAENNKLHDFCSYSWCKCAEDIEKIYKQCIEDTNELPISK